VAFDPAIGVPGRDDMRFRRAPERYIEIFVLAVEHKGDGVGVGLLELLQDSDQVHGAGQGVVPFVPVRRRIAKSSELLKAPAPFLSSFSRGLSSTGQLLIPVDRFAFFKMSRYPNA
jgi:hypothetical protein